MIGSICTYTDGPCNDCRYCKDEDEAVTVTAEDRDAERGDELRAQERDEALYLAVLKDTERGIS